MRKVIVLALGLYLLLYLLPLAAMGEEGRSRRPEESPAATLTPPRAQGDGSADGARTVRLLLEDGTVEELAMDEYLEGVVAAEMPASFHQQALNAQAAAARTYTVRKQLTGTSAHPEAELCTDTGCCQAYRPLAETAKGWGEQAGAYAEKIRRAVADTDGQVILYDGEPIQAVFFSTAAGETLPAAEVWGSEVPYLTGVKSPEGEEVPNYRTRVTVGAEEFRETVLAAHPEADLSGAPEDWLGPVEYGGGGSVAALTVGGAAIPGTELRELFSLRSASFTLTAEGEELVFDVTGYGHGVGMSQYGADAMAEAGAGWREILTWYYTGVTIGDCPVW